MDEAANVRWIRPAMSQAEEELEATVAAQGDWVESGSVLRCSRWCQFPLLPLNLLFSKMDLSVNLCEFSPSLTVCVSLSVWFPLVDLLEWEMDGEVLL